MDNLKRKGSQERGVLKNLPYSATKTYSLPLRLVTLRFPFWVALLMVGIAAASSSCGCDAAHPRRRMLVVNRRRRYPRRASFSKWENQLHCQGKQCPPQSVFASVIPLRGGGRSTQVVARQARSTSHQSNKTQRRPIAWQLGDALDRRLMQISLPVAANFAIAPLIGAIDLFWVNQMGDPLAVAGQAAANQVFTSVFFLTSFLPSVTATLIAKEHARGNTNGVQDAIAHALFVGFSLALISTSLLLWYPDKVLRSVLPDGAPAYRFAKPYLVIRSFSFIPTLVSLVGFSAFRGTMDTVTPVQISMIANLFHALLDPILIFFAGFGVPGAAMATLTAEMVSAVSYVILMRRRRMIDSIPKLLLRPPSWQQLQPLIRGGAALQLRNLSLNLTFLTVARVVQSLDSTGVAAAAHAMSLQTFQLGGIVFLALSTVAQVVVPSETHNSGKEAAKKVVGRLMSWGLALGVFFGLLQLLLIPVIQRSSPLQEVRDAALVPAILASVFQAVNGPVFIGEGVMIGTGSFMQLSLSTVLATLGTMLALQRLPSRYGLAGVWYGFGVFNALRFLGVCVHQRFSGPLTPRRINAEPVIQDVKRTSLS